MNFKMIQQIMLIKSYNRMMNLNSKEYMIES